ncbi:MAG: VWA domain-containing protein [Phycisphaerales bacterium]|nr:VWA domain-containing protein [Phycisphaerales bacterium]
MNVPPSIQRLVEWLLDLDHIRLGRDAPLLLQWQMPLPVWFLAPMVALLAVIVVIAYRGDGSARSRWLPAGIRIGLLLLVAVMICQPVLVLQRERIEPSRVVLLVDTSRSMAERDDYADDPPRAARIAAATGLNPVAVADRSRFELLTAALRHDGAAPLAAMLSRNELELYTFGRDLRRELSVTDAADREQVTSLLERLSADDAATNLHSALASILKQTGGERTAAVVLASDGRCTEPGSMGDAVGLARAQQVPIYPVLIGSPVPPRNVAVEPDAVQDRVHLRDSFIVRVRVTTSGLEADQRTALRVVDTADGAVWAERQVDLDPDAAEMEVSVRVKAARAGAVDLRVEIEPVNGEHDTTDNAFGAAIQVIDKPIRVLYVDGYPRFEFRYLKNTLLREPTIRSSIILLSADRDFAPEGTDPIVRFPTTADELAEYDVVLFGDVDPTGDWLSPGQQELLVEFVSHQGGGFGLIAGTRHAPIAFRGTPLEKLIPVRIDPDFLGRYDRPLDESLQPNITPDGRTGGLFHGIIADADANGIPDGPPNHAMPAVYWVARTLGARPGATVLAELTTAAAGEAAWPVMVLGRYGAGSVFFSAVDETWRWRRGGGEWWFDSFWLHVCRTLARPAVEGADRVTLRTDRQRYAFGEPVLVIAEIRDPALVTLSGHEWPIVIRDAADRPVERITLTRIGESVPRFEGSFTPRRAGTYALTPDESVVGSGGRDIKTVVYVSDADLERRRTQADHDGLARLAAETGGRTMELDEIADVTGGILDRSRRIPDDFVEPLWDSRLVLTVFILMIGCEWVLRKSRGLL